MIRFDNTNYITKIEYFLVTLQKIFKDMCIIMRTSILLFIISLFGLSKPVVAQSRATEPIVVIKTNLGSIKIKLYNETPLHRDNFLSLVTANYYNGILFHRIIKEFMIQTGDPDSKSAPKNKVLGMGGPGYTIPAEFNAKYIHKKGALAAARLGDEVNPKKESSGSQFYIVVGYPVTNETITSLETQRINDRKNDLMNQYLSKPENAKLVADLNECKKKGDKEGFNILMNKILATLDSDIKNLDLLKYTKEQVETYLSKGGTPHLDNDYTVFGEVIEGMDIVDKISKAMTDSNDRPKDDIIILSTEIIQK